MTHVLVTGGAGYIGSHACKALKAAGFTPVCYDNLSTGWQDAARFGPFEKGDLRARSQLLEVFTRYQPIAVMHFAAFSQVGESISEPGRYWDNNVMGSLSLLETARQVGCNKIIFSSTCATYGDQDGVILDERSAQYPINAYGASKLAIEQMLQHFETAYGMQHVIFRYFNVAGADPDGEIGECHHPETHLIPLMLQTILGQRKALTIYGTDYDTPDGTCIRDYVHVCDLVEAHIRGLKWLLADRPSRAFNLGSGSGFSVREVIDQGRLITNRAFPVNDGARRPGDCTRLVSGSQRALKELKWQPQRNNLSEMIKDAWRWHQSSGYEK